MIWHQLEIFIDSTLFYTNFEVFYINYQAVIAFKKERKKTFI